MKKILILAVLAIMAVGCAPSPEQIRAQKVKQMHDLITQMLTERMSEIGYKAIEFSEPDTVYSRFFDFDLQLYKIKVKNAKEAMERWEGVKYMESWYEENKRDFEMYSDSLKVQEALQSAFVPEVVGYAVTHTFSGTKGAFEKVKVQTRFVVDTTLTLINDEENIDVDWGGLTFAEIMGMVGDMPIEKLIE